VDVTELEQAGSELRCELGPSVGDNVVREAMVLEYMFQIQASCSFSIDVGSGRAEVCHFGEVVHAD
jgi:hypothetical protein